MRTNEDRLVASTALRTMSLLAIGVLSLAACTGEITGGDSNERPSVTFENDMEPWELEMVSVVEDRYEKMSTYASSEGGWGACVRAFKLGGAVAGELATRGCIGIGLAAIETGVGGVAAAVCFGADYVQLDRAVGSIAGTLVGYPLCGTGVVLTELMDNFRVIEVEVEDTSVEREYEDCDSPEVASWNTQECKDLYCDYKDIPDDGCKDTGEDPLSCSTYLDHATNAWDKALMRQQHLDECPKPSSYSLQGHEDAVDQALNRLDRCLEKFCTDRCVIEMQNDDLFFENC